MIFMRSIRVDRMMSHDRENGVVRGRLSSASSHASCSDCCCDVSVKSRPRSELPSLNGMLLSSAMNVMSGFVVGNSNRYQRDGMVQRVALALAFPRRAYSNSESTLLSGHR
jgi:hypothetical protein